MIIGTVQCGKLKCTARTCTMVSYLLLIPLNCQSITFSATRWSHGMQQKKRMYQTMRKKNVLKWWIRAVNRIFKVLKDYHLFKAVKKHTRMTRVSLFSTYSISPFIIEITLNTTYIRHNYIYSIWPNIWCFSVRISHKKNPQSFLIS